MPSGHGQHRVVPWQREIEGHWQRGQVGLGALRQVFQAVEAVLVDPRGVPPRHVGGGHGQPVFLGQVQQRLVVCGVVGPRLAAASSLSKLTTPARYSFTTSWSSASNISAPKLGGPPGPTGCAPAPAEPMHDGVVVQFLEAHHVGFKASVTKSDQVDRCAITGTGRRRRVARMDLDWAFVWDHAKHDVKVQEEKEGWVFHGRFCQVCMTPGGSGIDGRLVCSFNAHGNP